MRLFSSNDGTNWTQIQDWTNLTAADWATGNTVGPYNAPANTTGRYFRIVINELQNTAGVYGQIAVFDLKGLLPSEEASSAGYPLDASGTSVPALKSIYEQLMNVPGRSQIMETRDVSGVQDNSNSTITGGFPFIAGDKLVMYLRPKIVFATQTHPEQFTTLLGFPNTTSPTVPVYNISNDGNGGTTSVITGQSYSQSSSQNSEFVFEKSCNTFPSTITDRWWQSAGNTYYAYNDTTNTPSTHSGSGSTTSIGPNNDTLDGEWGQVDIGQETYVTQLEIGAAQNYAKAPREFKLLGSLTGTSWTELLHVTDAGPWGQLIAGNYAGNGWAYSNNWNISNPSNYRYYRFVVIKLNSSNVNNHAARRCAIGRFILKGVKYPSEVAAGSGAGDPATQPAAAGVDISGLVTNFSNTPQNISDAFPGNATGGNESELEKWGWMGSANSDTLSLETTDIQDTNTIDLHIWKITITL